jgi:PAS domain S-box-containing protein
MAILGHDEKGAAVPFDISERRRADEAQERLAAIVTSSNDAIIGKTPDGIVTSWNEAAEHLFGYAACEMIGQSIRRVIPGDRQREEDMILASLARGERIENYETVRIAKDGRAINVSVTVSPVRNEEGRIIGASKIVRDITERKRAEELLRRQADLLDQSHDAIFTWKIGGGIAYWSRGAERLYGYTAEEAMGRSSHELLRTRSPTLMQEVEAQIAREGSWYGELTHTTRDGRVIPVESRHVRVSYNGETYALETNRDITARKQAELRLAEREAQLALFIEHAPAAIAMFDDQMRYLAVSRRFLSDYQLPAANEVVGRSHYEVFPDIPQRWRKIHARVLAGEELGHEEDPFPRQDGRFELVQWSMKPWRTADGRIGGALLYSQFMTRTLADTEARFQATFENAAVGIAHIARDGRFLRVNDALCRILGYPVDELLTNSVQDITCPDDLAADLAQVELMGEGKINSYSIEKRYLRKNGAIIWGRKTVGCVRKGDGSIDYFVAVLEDISARKAHDDQVRLLMREVNHRAKNMLSLVQAIARQTAARKPEDFIERFGERVQALAANQNLLVRNEWQGVDIEDLARAQLAHFADLVGSRMTVCGPTIRLNAAAAQAIGLALHELATNAGKYGALSVDAGRVDVRWRIDGDVFAMSWIECNGPPVSRPKRQGFGSTVIASMAKATVGGEVQLDYAPSGVTWRLTCPAANVVESFEPSTRATFSE